MKTPREKYLNDHMYMSLVNMLTSYIHQAQFTPSELREAAILACIRYEEQKVMDFKVLVPDKNIEDALNTLHEWVGVIS